MVISQPSDVDFRLTNRFFSREVSLQHPCSSEESQLKGRSQKEVLQSWSRFFGRKQKQTTRPSTKLDSPSPEDVKTSFADLKPINSGSADLSPWTLKLPHKNGISPHNFVG